MRPTGEARDRLELLAPAGDGEALRAAVANGADAVYFGLQEFNARRRAANFTLEALPQIVDQLHGWNVKAYVAFNTLIFSDELEQAARYIAGIAEAGADALIVQDLGVLRLARAMCPALPVHASTQMTQTHAAGINFLRELGVSRVILARELSLKDIAAIRAATEMELEAFVHGALCVSYSGQCLASESLFGRSANRGQCAQPCRLPYQLVVDGEPREMPDGAHLLSPKDLATYGRIPDLLAAGVTSFKIEGRLKSAEYVAAATGVYRAAIDAAAVGRPLTITKQQLSDLEASFSRGFTQGFLDGNRHQDLVDRSSPKSRGPRVGVVAGKSGAGITVRLSDVERELPLKPGDGVVFGGAGAEEQGGRVYSVQPVPPTGDSRRNAAGWHGLGREAKPNETGRGHTHGPRHGLSARLRRGPDRAIRPERDSPAGQVEVLLTFGSGDLDLAAIRVGSTVWKSDDPQARRRIEQTYSRIEPWRRTPLRARATLLESGHLALELETVARSQFPVASSLRVEVSSDAPLARADKHPLTLALLREQLERLGDTPYELRDVELIGPEGAADSLPVLAPKSVLNDLRRRAVAGLLEQRRIQARKPVEDANALSRLREAARTAGGGEGACRRGDEPQLEHATQSRLHVLVRTREQLEAVLNWTGNRAEALQAPSAKRRDGNSEADPFALRSGPIETATHLGMIYCDLPDLADMRAGAAACRAARMSFAIAGPRILKPREEALLKPLLELRPEALLVRNLAALRYAREHAPDLPLIGDFSLNAANELAADLLLDSGLARVTASCDLNVEQLARMLSRYQLQATCDDPASSLSNRKPETRNWQLETGSWELVIHQHMPMFHTAYCLAAACLGTSNDCRDCERPCERFDIELRDRLGVDHPLLTDAAGRCTIFNARPQSAAEFWEKLTRLKIGHYRIELLRESPVATTTLLEAYEGLLLDQITPREAVNRIASLYAQGVTPGTFAFTERDSRR